MSKQDEWKAMHRKNLIHCKGDTLLLSSGEYDCYSIGGMYMVLKDFDTVEQLKAYAVSVDYHYEDFELVGPLSCPPLTEELELDFTAWLVKNELIGKVAYKEMHLGSYGRIQL